MAFNSAQFLIFFPIVLLVYFALPQRVRYIWLLAASYYFYMCWNPVYILLILTSTVITYASGLLLEKIKKDDRLIEKDKYKKYVVASSVILNLGILFYFKYTNFALELMQGIFEQVGLTVNVPKVDVLLPVGISFYTFQALSYTIDVYRDEIYAEKNFLRYALFVSFFPQLVAGPIERSKNLLKQLAEPKRFDFDMAREGLFLMLWGYFLKLVVGDRAALFVDTVYGDYTSYPGVYLVLATILFAIQIYCDFAGYSIIAMGAAKFLGIQLMENFNAPYLATSVPEFWRKWHISLTSWFKDYLYIPLGGSRKGKLRKYINVMIVFLVSGLWHGAALTFVVWGGLNGLYQIIGDLLMPLRDKIVRILHLHRESFGHRLISCLVTFLLVDLAWVFFRADTIADALDMLESMVSVKNPWVLLDGSIYTCGLDLQNFWLLIIGIGILLFTDIMKYRGVKIREFLISQDYWFRWLFIDLAVIVILVFGIWGSTYDATNFIYFQF